MGGKNEKDTVSECVVPQCMKFTIFDSWGDGLWSGGSYYKTSWDKEIVLERQGDGENWESESVEFGCDDDTAPPNLAPSPTASPTDAPTASPTTSSPVTCPAGQSLLEIELQADEKSESQNKYIVAERNEDGKFKKKVLNVKTGNIPNKKLHLSKTCVNDNACFRFALIDSESNGLCCEDGQGYYRVTLGGVQMQYSIFQNGKK